MSHIQTRPRIAVIGAGLSGLIAAQRLSSYAEVKVFEKSRGVAGRLATRRTEHSRFDHGAMGFDADTRQAGEFTDFVTELLERGVVGPWSVNRATWENGQLAACLSDDTNTDYYVGLPNMNAIGKYLACGLDIQLNTRVASLVQDGDWVLIDNHQNTLGRFDWVISSVPPAQAAALVPRSFEHSDVLDTVAMAPCLSLMLSSLDDTTAPPFGYIQANDEIIDTIIVNSHKPLRDTHNSIVVQSTSAWAAQQWQRDRTEVASIMLGCAERILGMSLTGYQQALHGWLYARKPIADNADTQPVWVDQKRQLIACGDWCLDGTVEAAFTSGVAAAQAIQR